ncbi:DNA recombination protein RmuC [Rhodobacteraceae bacterium]|nr:DNA recombination protein RmuC [Paracoccaceae bacterium]
MIASGIISVNWSDPVALWALAATSVGAFCAVALIRTKGRQAQDLADLSRLSTELQHAHAQLHEAHAWRDEAHRLRPQLSAAQARIERVDALEDQADELRDALNDEYRGRVQAQQAYESLEREHKARLEELRGMKAEIEDRFSTVASGVLQKNTDAFLKLVSERFNTHRKSAQEELDQRRHAIEHLVKPLHERLGRFDEQIREMEKNRTEAYGAIQEQVKHLAEGQAHLGQETRRLVQALRAPKTRGRWGEMQLRQVFEMAGMAENVDFLLEHHVNTDDGARRPDAVVKLPGGRTIVVDAKTPLEGYLDALEAETPEQQTTHLARHAKQMREHVRMLSSKAYQDKILGTPDFVVMFIPGETFVAAAAEADPGLIEYAFENKILIASPTTLMALVKAIAYGWQQEKMAKNAIEVQKTAKELYDRLKTFGGHIDAVGKALTRSVDSYNRAVGSLEGRVLPSARKFETMGVVTEENSLDPPDLVENQARAVTALAEHNDI